MHKRANKFNSFTTNFQVIHKGEMLSYTKQCDQQINNNLYCLPDAFIFSNGIVGQLSPITFPYWNISIFK